MTRTFSSTGPLTLLEAALDALLHGVMPVTPRLVPLEQALGYVAAGMPPVVPAQPVRDIAAIDGWACRALDLVGASAYSPLVLPVAPIWVETGEAMPEDRDCMLQAGLVDCSGPMIQAAAEAVPGQGVRRAGEDMAAARPPMLEGKAIGVADLLVARKVGLSQLAIRSPRVRVIDVAADSHETFSMRLVVESLSASGVSIVGIETVERDAASIIVALDGEACDFLLLIGGTGDGHADVTAEALARRGVLIGHGIALRPGGTTAIGRLGKTPVVALAGSPHQAFAGFLALVQPVLDRLSGRSERPGIILPLSRKISSAVGLYELVLLGKERDMWTPLAVGDFSLDAMRLADAWLAVPGDSEGYAAGTPVSAFPLRNF
ncbi:molybdopterin-binding protein [Mesorhizobium sp. B2-2-3]|uniref:molybdopterin-binding protein n=1 Tax=Mesorhizobium sp. B2-2-3 TaxID=2589963 RepID=UPI00112780EF|nr:molybdopterin-binding protein [Mesorhizobium sp. B2-2-3]TPM43468.1 molybdopterin-binding protein [Mesorhizobium sp. B2-2-3]